MSGPAVTSAAREAWVARRLGAGADAAERLAARLVAERRLADGTALVVGLHATRRGMDLGAAAEELADGERRLPVGASAYERRTVTDEVDDAWRADAADPPPAVDDADAVARGPEHLGR